ncbi:MAG: M3 family oligoendopeptidase [Bacteroidales bacterium]|nr:M3 family oligoendopeptidase [Bacteroidales bacterium]
MSSLLNQAKQKRKFVSSELQINSWDDVRPYFEQLLAFNIDSSDAIKQFLAFRSELEAVLEEDMSWRYIKMTCDTSNSELRDSFNVFVTEIDPEIQKNSNLLDKKCLSSEYFQQLEGDYCIMKRAMQQREALFREENVPLIADLQTMEQEYGNITSQMTIEFEGTKTLQQAAVYLKKTDRSVRETVYKMIQNRRLQDEKSLNDNLSKMIGKRHQVAKNAGFENFRDYKFQSLCRFDYTKEDCFAFHSAIQRSVPPVLSKLNQERKEKLQLNQLRPWDMDVDPDQKAPLKPFENSNDFKQKAIACFNEIKPFYGQCLQLLSDNNYWDLESRIGKAPGGYNNPLYESNVPFIFMNAAGTLHDVETIVHEGGHAIHSIISADLPLVDFKDLPSEVAELASMSMELISMEHWHVFFPDEADLKRAKKSQLEGVLSVLPWIAIVDKFQHWLYENPTHSANEREEEWVKILKEFEGSNGVEWDGLENIRRCTWQKQLHIFEVPFYYIEYGFAQLGAIAMWKQYKENPQKALKHYEAFMKLGYTKSIPEIYKAAGIEFSFSYDYVKNLTDFVYSEIEKLK